MLPDDGARHPVCARVRMPLRFADVHRPCASPLPVRACKGAERLWILERHHIEIRVSIASVSGSSVQPWTRLVFSHG